MIVSTTASMNVDTSEENFQNPAQGSKSANHYNMPSSTSANNFIELTALINTRTDTHVI